MIIFIFCCDFVLSSRPNGNNQNYEDVHQQGHMVCNNGDFIEMPIPQRGIQNGYGMQHDFCGKVGRKSVSRHSTYPYPVQEVQRDESRCIDSTYGLGSSESPFSGGSYSMPPNELSREDIERELRSLCGGNDTSELYPDDSMPPNEL
jgi:hypothetical protein